MKMEHCIPVRLVITLGRDEHKADGEPCDEAPHAMTFVWLNPRLLETINIVVDVYGGGLVRICR